VRFCALALVLLVLPIEAGALEQGARVRVTLIAREAPHVTGSVLAIPADSLVIAAEPDSAREAIARLDIKKLEISRGIHSNAGKGAMIGALVVGVAFGLYAMSRVSADEVGTGGVVVVGLAGGVVGGLAGGGVGALIGSGSRHESWHEIRVKKAEVP